MEVLSILNFRPGILSGTRFKLPLDTWIGCLPKKELIKGDITVENLMLINSSGQGIRNNCCVFAKIVVNLYIKEELFSFFIIGSIYLEESNKT